MEKCINCPVKTYIQLKLLIGENEIKKFTDEFRIN